jgi:hypothetical protein
MSDNEYQSDNENIWGENEISRLHFTQNDEIEWGSEDENETEVVAPVVPTQPEGTATIGGMRTQYAERKAFCDNLNNLVKHAEEFPQLTPYVSALKNDAVYKRLQSSALRGERKECESVIAKAENAKEYKWCERCDTHIKKKGWAKHRRSERCLQIYNSKKLAVNITNVEREKVGRFAKTPIHPFYLVGQSLVSAFSKQKAKDADRLNEEWDAVRLPPQTQQIPDEVGDLESIYDLQETYDNVVANVANNLTLALILPAEENPEPAPKEKKPRKPRAQVSVPEVSEEPKKKGGRPKGSKNKKVEVPLAEATEETIVKKPKKKIIIVEPETPPPAEETKEPEPEPEPEQVPSKRYVAEGLMSRSFYQEYIRPKMSEKGQALMDAVYGDCEDDEMGVEYRVCSWGNPKDYINEYSELWLLDCEPDAGFYYPVVVGEINTSSAYAMCRCGMDRDPDEEEEQDLMKTDAEIMEMVKQRNHDKILQILQSRRKDGK